MSQPEAAAPLAPPGARSDCRCLCGSLLARLTAGGVELKCRRCKRTLLVPLPRSAAVRPVAVPVREIG